MITFDVLWRLLEQDAEFSITFLHSVVVLQRTPQIGTEMIGAHRACRSNWFCQVNMQICFFLTGCCRFPHCFIELKQGQ